MPTSSRHVALLRGINVGGHAKVPMSELRAVVELLGHTDVATYIQSGNVVFTSTQSDAAALSHALEEAIADRIGVACAVVVMSSADLARVVSSNPYADEPDHKRVHVLFLTAPADAALRRAVAEARQQAAAKGSRDTAHVGKRVVYLHTPDGYGRSELAPILGRRTAKSGVATTARNWATVLKLQEMLAG